MLKSIKYVLKENFSNLFRIYSISKYELLSDMRDSRLESLEFCKSSNSNFNILFCFWGCYGS